MKQLRDIEEQLDKHVRETARVREELRNLAVLPKIAHSSVELRKSLQFDVSTFYVLQEASRNFLLKARSGSKGP
jgi:hypothetical protein